MRAAPMLVDYRGVSVVGFVASGTKGVATVIFMTAEVAIDIDCNFLKMRATAFYEAGGRFPRPARCFFIVCFSITVGCRGVLFAAFVAFLSSIAMLLSWRVSNFEFFNLLACLADSCKVWALAVIDDIG